VLVKILFGMTGDTEAEEAVVASFAAIGTLKRQTVTDPIIGAFSQRRVSLETTCEEGSFKVRYCLFRPLDVEPVFLTTILAMVFAAVAERAFSVMLIAGIPVFDQCFFVGSCPSRWAIGFLDQEIPQ
jgi:hypothetical protein